MSTYRKALALILALTLGLSLASCSTIQSAIGSITGQEDPSVAGNKPAGNHDDEDTWTPPSSSIPAPVEREIDERAKPVEIDGITIQKYKNSGYTVIDLGGGVHSDIHEIALIDGHGNELMPFPSDKPFRTYADNLLSEEAMAYYETYKHDSGWLEYIIKIFGYYTGIDGDDINLVPLIVFRDVPESDISLLDLKCDSVLQIRGGALPIIAECLGTPTSLVATWNTMDFCISHIDYVWICDGFYVEGSVSLETINRGDYKTLSYMEFHLCSGDPDRDYLDTPFTQTKAELGLG